MNIKTLCITGALLIAGTGVYAQKKKEVINDSNTPLHLLQPAYKVPYKALSTDEVKKDMDRVLHYLEGNTPTRVVSAKTGKAVTDYKNMPADAQLERGAFRLASYEWGVTYSAMLAAAEATGDAAYKKYVTDRFRFLSEVAPYFRAMLEKSGKAGRSRWLGRRPHNRGVVMNPVDHPMGGGEGRQSGGHPRSRTGLYAKGLKTRSPKKHSSKYIIERRKK